MCPGIAASKQKGNADTQCYLNPHQRIQKKQTKAFIKHVQIDNLLKRGTRNEVIVDRWSAPVKCFISASDALPKWIPVGAQAVVADAFQAAARGFYIGDRKSASYQELELLVYASVRFGVQV